jgi:glycosyltransferase involved in cell wall biosynthesis
MRIAILTEVFLPKVDGVVNRTVNHVRHLTSLGDEVMVFCPQVEGCTATPVPVVHFPSFAFPLYPEYHVGLPDRRLVEAVEKFAPDVIHYINPFAFGFRCYDVLHKAGIRTPSVFSFHTLYGEFVKQYKALKPLSALLWWMTREYHNCADVNMTVSSIMQEELVQRGFRRVELWPPAVDGELFHPTRRSDAMRARLSNGRPERPLLLTVSRLAPEKNVGFLADVLREIPDATLAIVGDGPYRAELERRFSDVSAHFVGYLKGQELAAAYASADGFIYASETETMGNVILEAMASGCAVVAPHAGGIPSLLSHDNAGLLYRPGELQEVVKFTRQVLSDDATRARLGQAARQTIEERNWEYSARRVRQVYTAAIEESKRSPAAWTWQKRLAQATAMTLVTGFRSLAAVKEQASRLKHLKPSSFGRKRGNSAGSAPRTPSAPQTADVPSDTSR